MTVAPMLLFAPAVASEAAIRATAANAHFVPHCSHLHVKFARSSFAVAANGSSEPKVQYFRNAANVGFPVSIADYSSVGE